MRSGKRGGRYNAPAQLSCRTAHPWTSPIQSKVHPICPSYSKGSQPGPRQSREGPQWSHCHDCCHHLQGYPCRSTTLSDQAAFHCQLTDHTSAGTRRNPSQHPRQVRLYRTALGRHDRSTNASVTIPSPVCVPAPPGVFLPRAMILPEPGEIGDLTSLNH